MVIKKLSKGQIRRKVAKRDSQKELIKKYNNRSKRNSFKFMINKILNLLQEGYTELAIENFNRAKSYGHSQSTKGFLCKTKVNKILSKVEKKIPLSQELN